MSDNRKRSEEALGSLQRELKSRERKEKARPFGVVLWSLLAILAIAGGITYLATREPSPEQIQADSAAESEKQSEEQTPQGEPLAMKRAKALPATVKCEYFDSKEKAAKKVSKPKTRDVSAKGTVNVTLNTNQGKIGMELDRAASPCTVNAIEHLADEGYYDDTVCHRMTTSGIFVLQCGDPTGKGSGGPGFTFANEYPTDEANGSTDPVIYPRGSIAMANAGKDKEGRDTNGSQFFLNYKDSPLAPDYTYFGQISEEGLKTIDKVAEAGVKGDSTAMGDGEPAEEVKIKSAKVA